MPAKRKTGVVIPPHEAAEIRAYIARLESRVTFAENEARTFRASRTIRIANVFGEIRQGPMRPGPWLAAPARLLAALASTTAEKAAIERKRFESLGQAAETVDVDARMASAPMEPATPIGALYQRTVLALSGHERIAGVAAPARIAAVSPNAAFSAVRPADYDHVFRVSEATAFVVDLDHILDDGALWRGALSMTNIPLGVELARCIETARRMGLATFLAPSTAPHRFPMLDDVRDMFDAEISF